MVQLCPIPVRSAVRVNSNHCSIKPRCDTKQRSARASFRSASNVCSAPSERKDLTDFAHNAPATIDRCSRCGLLVRNEEKDPTRTYVEDSYDFSAIEAILPRYVDAFRAKEEPYRKALPSGARVLEIGPHFGAFLQVATEWSWSAEGVDIGKDTAAYLTGRGYRIHHCAIQDCGLDPESFEAVFIWNCFEQIEDPHTTLVECRRVLKRGGALLLRTPNARYFEACEQFLGSQSDPAFADPIVAALGYDNLLAFPYLYGYDSKTLAQVAAKHGFEAECVVDTELIILPFPELPAWMVAERRAIATAVRALQPVREAEAGGYSIAPWIEILFRSR